MTPKYKKTSGQTTQDQLHVSSLKPPHTTGLREGERRPIMFHFSAGQPAFCCLFGFLLICYHSSPNTRYKAASETIVCQHPDGPHEAELCKQKNTEGQSSAALFNAELVLLGRVLFTLSSEEANDFSVSCLVWIQHNSLKLHTWINLMRSS